MLKKIALIGNTNCGKTTLFNTLTGAREYTSNRSGVTVNINLGRIKNTDFLLCDLPGIYSLSAVSEDEQCAINFISDKKPVGIINIADGNNLERSLYLSVQLLLKNIPVILAINMADEIERKGIHIDTKKLSEVLGIKCLLISAKSGQGIPALISALHNLKLPHTIVKEQYTLYYNSFESNIEDVRKANAIYKIAEEAVKFAVYKPLKKKKTERRLDKIFLNKYLGIPIFILIMSLIFYLSFGLPGKCIRILFENSFDFIITNPLSLLLYKLNISPLLYSLITDGIISSIGLVVSFIPQIILLFTFISVLEDSGYIMRAAFMLDKLFRKIGLSGKSFIPLVLGFGCTTTAVMSARGIGDIEERKLSILLTPYMSCGAKLPVYLYFADIFFKGREAMVVILMYFTGILTAILIGKIFSKRKKESSPFIIELPEYRIPTLKNTLRLITKKSGEFLLRAGTTIFLMSVLVWILQHLSLDLKFTLSDNESILAKFGEILSPFFSPLGFGDWRALVSLLSGLAAKETIVSSLNILYTPSGITDFFTPASAISFMTFSLLYPPCFSAVTTMAKELKNKKWLAGAMLIHILIAYSASFIIYSLHNILLQGKCHI